MPVNGLIVRALLQYYGYYGNDFKVECPTGSGRLMTLYQVAEEIMSRLANMFLKDKDGRRPIYGGVEKFQADPHLAHDLISVPTSTSTATTAPASAPAIKPAGPALSPAACTCSRPPRPSKYSNWVSWPLSLTCNKPGSGLSWRGGIGDRGRGGGREKGRRGRREGEEGGGGAGRG